MLNLLITASIGSYTYNYGATELLIPQETLFSYLNQLVMPELAMQGESIDELSLLKATCMKFVYFFRNQIPDEHVPLVVNLMADYLKSQHAVNQSYAAACVEKMLIRKKLDGSGNVLTEHNVDQNILGKLLQNLCELLNQSKDLYAVRALLRVI
jgi:hypothetical protein